MTPTILHLERKFTAPTETFIANQINFLSGYESIVFTGEYLDTLKVNAKVFEGRTESFFAGKILTGNQIGYFNSVYNDNRPSIIHGHFLTDTSYFHPFTRKLDIPKVCSGYGYDVSSFPKKFLNLGALYFKGIFKEYDHFLAMSNDMAKDMIKMGCPESKIIVHYYGTDTRFFNIEREYEDRETLNLLTIASLLPKKGHINVLKALKHLRVNSPQVKIKYNVVGKGPLLQSFQKYVTENGLDEVVNFAGPIKYGEGLLDVIKKADVFLHPSVTDENGAKEGIPGAIVEAMASGLPVIATYHAGIPEIINDKHDGLLVKENDFETIADLIANLYNNTKTRQEIGVNAKHSALTKLDIRSKTKDLQNIYHNLLH